MGFSLVAIRDGADTDGRIWPVLASKTGGMLIEREDLERQERLARALQLQHAEAISPIQAGSGLEGAAAGAAGASGPGQASAPATAPFVRAVPKVGRNEACPCGSGKKYKHCHGALQQASG